MASAVAVDGAGTLIRRQPAASACPKPSLHDIYVIVRVTRLDVCAVALLAALATSCSSDTSGAAGDAGIDGIAISGDGGHDGSQPTDGSAQPPDGASDAVPDSAGAVCVSPCTSDLACEQSCPTPTNGINCCDLSTGLCFVSNLAVCPSPADSSIPDGPY
jgi:hypothetical protein